MKTRVFKKYARIWWCLVSNSFRAQMASSLASAGYLLGKIVRFGFFLIYLVAIFNHLPSLKGYTMPEVVLVFMAFNIVDVGAQFLFRGFYGVKMLIDEGDLDRILTQPAHPLFRISAMGIDFLDLFTLIPIFWVTGWSINKLPQTVGPLDLLLFFALIFNALIIAYAFHVFVGALSVRTHGFESAIWVYRDVMTLGRFPVTIYSKGVSLLLLTLVPIGVMITFPVEALLGRLSVKAVGYSFAVALVFHLATQLFWRRSLEQYSSTSS